MVSEQRFSDYRFVRRIAEGGMGHVELAVREQGVFRRAYAIKQLKPGLVADPERRRMFVQEARYAGLLHHPNVVSVVDVGQDDSGPYLVMDYVPGVTLAQLVARAKADPVDLAVRLVKQAADGLHAAHELRDHDGEAQEPEVEVVEPAMTKAGAGLGACP